jgi:pSer/pThr/pTyr-binding forkhead associated (FHA) protein
MAGPEGELRIVEPPAEERVVQLDWQTPLITIGRDPDCAVVLSSPYVGRRHATIELRADGAVLLDHGSRNGSLVNGVRVVGERRLRGGDVITIADTTIQYQAAEPALSVTRTYPPTPRSAEPALPLKDDRLLVDAKTYAVYLGGRPLERSLSAQEFQLLSHLYEHRDRVCTRDELGALVWGAGNWDTNMLHRLVHRLKAKLEPGQATSRYIQTVPWVGYRLSV